ncbi:hypothetical protein chiPu_0029278, partial [Chiloscyllium punctatum]|nr:hypothetical protein [Chiloscyllium punctatum]
TLTCDFRAERQGGERQNVADDLPFDLDGSVARYSRNRERGIGRQALLDEVRFRQRQFVVGRLKAPVAEERDLDRGFDVQGPAQQPLDRIVRDHDIVGGPDRDHVLLDGAAGDVGHRRHAAVRRERCATREQQRG